NCYDGQTLRLGEATIKFYNRQLSFVDDANFANIAETTKINLDSLIFQIVYKSNKFFFLGDSGTSSNNYVSDKYSAAVLKSDVIKVSHHGMSANNTAGIISKVAAKVAINSSSSDFAIEALTTSRLRAANSAVKIYETWNVINYVSSTDQSNTYIGLMVAADGTNIKTYGVYNWGNTSCNKAEVVK
ncbi:MAG TPA: hypothetical protein VHQ24_09645, partial [Lachnospiraceae bacterium]|nr:hypothetical protein [Lachnospiraceae bacterium]